MIKDQELKKCKEFDVPKLVSLSSSVKIFKPRRDIPEWAEQKRTMPPGTPFEGKWRNDRAPFWKEIAYHCSSSSPTECVAILKAGQIGATANIAENKMGNAIEDDPQAILYITATTTAAKEWSQKRFGPLMDSCGLTDMVSPIGETSKKSRSGGDTTLSKSFKNGAFVLFASYNQEAMLRVNSFRTVIFDELDAAPITGGVEGSVRKRAAVRTSMFEGRQKMIFLSTPLDKSTSRIWDVFSEGDQCYCWMHCPHCGEMINMRLLDDAMKINLVFDFKSEDERIIDPKTVGYPCDHCGTLIKTHDKYEMFKNGYEFRPTNENPKPKSKSFFVDVLYAAIGGVSFERLAQEWVDAQGDPDDFRAYINLRGGLPYEDTAEGVTDEQIMSKVGGYKRGEKAEDAILVTCGGDLHGDRLDVVIKGYNGKTNWTIDWMQFLGDPTMNDGGSLHQFAKAFSSGKIPGSPKCAFLDSGYEPAQVLKCAETHPDIFAVGGEKWIRGGAVFAESVMKKFNGAAYIRVNTGVLKGYIMHSLRMERIGEDYPEGYSHFPANMPKAFFDQLNSERRVPIYKTGSKKIQGWEWKERHTKGNHVLDCTVYADAACHYQIYRISQYISIDEGYVDIVWECLRDPDKIDALAQSGAFS